MVEQVMRGRAPSAASGLALAFGATRITGSKTTIGIEGTIRALVDALAIEVNRIAQARITTVALSSALGTGRQATIADSIQRECALGA